MYHLHLGTDTCWNVGGWDIALFGEIGYTEKSESFSPRGSATSQPPPSSSDNISVSDLDAVFQELADYSFANTSYDLRIVPITANIKFERAITQQLGVYAGAGLGVANIDFSANNGAASFSDDDWVFVAQAFAGLVYNVNQAFEVYGGARYMYFDDPSYSFGGMSGELDMDDDFLLELGGRFNF